MQGNQRDPAEANLTPRLKKLIEANQSLADIESLDELVSKLLDLAREVTSSEAASLLLYDPHNQILEFKAAKDERCGEQTADILKDSIKLKIGQGIAGQVAETRQPLIVEDASRDPRFYNKADKATGLITRTLMAVPVLHQDELLGVIEVLNTKNKPNFDRSDQMIMESFANLAAVAIIRSQLLEERLERQKLNIQMETASKIQQLFWPKSREILNDCRIWAFTEPAYFVGGDLYDFIPLPDGSWLAYVADVSDKGLPASLVMVALWARIRSESHLQENLSSLLEAANNAMSRLLEKEYYFATLIICRYWPQTGRLRIANAGHLPPLWIKPDGIGNIPKLEGAPLGVMPDLKFPAEEIILGRGESIIFVTDGVTEAENHQQEQFGTERLTDHVKGSTGPPWGKSLVHRVKSWRGDIEANDDLTVLEIWRTGD